MAINKYTVVEAQNIQLGQIGSAFHTTTAQYIPPSGLKIIMITMLTDTEFSGLIASDTDQNFGTSAASPGTGGQTLTSSHTFPAGITIFGRWDSCTLNAAGDKVLIYFGS